MLKLMISGITGRMGRLVAELAGSDPDITVIGGTSQHVVSENLARDGQAVAISTEPEQFVPKSDVIIDFSAPSALEKLLNIAVKYKKPLVTGTTGFADLSMLEKASKSIPVFYSANFSSGIHLINKLIPTILKAMPIEEYDVELIETHHRGKKDAPSGTALTIGQNIAKALSKQLKDILRNPSDPRKSGEIGISSIRGGNVFGEHELMFLGQEETLAVKHTVMDRKVFARTAVKAAQWLVQQPSGLYGMGDIF
ncbi:MAG: 4-hydroxy-tetrahydrodipicolinate reductase [Holosporales bacterium]|jgi:4-hydroxy-tetrahydrodipicolinate reductase|nr:4-hydroxy-tetrahydrodipicolinate reductase [Holosporales bacterium]